MTTRRWFSRLGGLLVASISLAACSGEPADSPDEVGGAPPSPKVLVIGIDGVRPDILAEVSTPNIDALIATGTFSDRAQTSFPSVSGPGWSSFLIGVWPEKHGVTNNEFENKHYDEYPDFLTRIEQVRPELNTFAVADWLPLVAEDHNGPVISQLVDEVHAIDGYEFGWPEADSISTDMAVDHLLTDDPDALFVYLGNPDETSHQNGSIGSEYRASLAAADRNVGRLIEAMRSRPSYVQEDWLVVMSTDHGRREDGGHGGDTPEERTIFLLVSGSAVAVGSPSEAPGVVDVAVTALAHLGIEIDPAWALDGRAVGSGR